MALPYTHKKPTLEIKWWDWSGEKIKKNKKFFTTDLSELDDVYELIVD